MYIDIYVCMYIYMCIDFFLATQIQKSRSAIHNTYPYIYIQTETEDFMLGNSHISRPQTSESGWFTCQAARWWLLDFNKTSRSLLLLPRPPPPPRLASHADSHLDPTPDMAKLPPLCGVLYRDTVPERMPDKMSHECQKFCSNRMPEKRFNVRWYVR